MNQETTGNTRRPPWHLWLIGVLALAWNGAGAVDYVMTKTRNAAYLGSFTPEQIWELVAYLQHLSTLPPKAKD